MDSTSWVVLPTKKLLSAVTCHQGVRMSQNDVFRSSSDSDLFQRRYCERMAVLLGWAYYVVPSIPLSHSYQILQVYQNRFADSLQHQESEQG